jgi:uncharacterized protein YcbX
MTAGTVRIRSLHVYPVKSCAGIDLDMARLGPRGFDADRQWMIVDQRQRFLTQRTHPALARVRTELTPEQLTLSVPGHGSIGLPREDAAAAQAPIMIVEIWGDRVPAHSAGPEAAAWLSDLLGTPATLVRPSPAMHREPDATYRGQIAAPVNFPDAYPLLVCSTASLADLQSRMPATADLPMNRFRPNIVIEGCGAFEEDRIHELSEGDIRLRLVKACTRCATTTVDQHSGQPGADPLPVLRGYRFDRKLKGVTFGQNAVIVSGVNRTLKVGQTLHVVTSAP